MGSSASPAELSPLREGVQNRFNFLRRHLAIGHLEEPKKQSKTSTAKAEIAAKSIASLQAKHPSLQCMRHTGSCNSSIRTLPTTLQAQSVLQRVVSHLPCAHKLAQVLGRKKKKKKKNTFANRKTELSNILSSSFAALTAVTGHFKGGHVQHCQSCSSRQSASLQHTSGSTA